MDTDKEAQNLKDCEPTQKKKLVEIPTGIINEKEWDSIFGAIYKGSLYLEFGLGRHYEAWWKLIESAHLKQNECETIVECLKEMIGSIPMGTLAAEKQWFCYLKGIYYLERNKKLSPEAAETLLELTEKKLAITYNKASSYWSMIRKLEKKREWDSDDMYVQKCIDTYVKQFTLPYIDMKGDYKKFLHFVDDKNIDINEVESIKALYNKNKPESDRIRYFFWSCFDETTPHHVQFEEWISEMLNESPQLIERAVALCEEAVVDEKESVCYHFVLAKTLARCDMSEPTNKDKLFKALKRGIYLGQDECENMMLHFLDYAMQVASLHLSSTDCLELMDDMIIQFKFFESVPNYLASRKAIIFGIKALVEKEKFPKKDIQRKFVQALDPVMIPEFYEDVLEVGKNSMPDFESKHIELIKLVLLVEKQLTENTWQDIFNKWEDMCSETESPEVLVEYTEFYREHGSPAEAEDAYLRALTKMSSLNNNKSSCTYSTRRCELLLMNNLRKLLAIHGGKTNVIELLNDLSKRQSFLSNSNGENYYLDCHPQISEEYVAQLVFKGTSSNYATNAILENGSSQNSDPTQDVVPVIDEMKKLTVKQHTGSSAGFPVFLSNLQFKATKKDIVNAFKKEGLNVINILMKMTPKNTNYGFAVVEFSSLEESQQALSNCDHLEILGRKTFVSEYKEKPGYSAAPLKPQPTVLFISDLPEEWKNPKRIESALLPFGHIKSVEVQDEAAIAKVEYHMPEDLLIGCMKLEELLVGTGAVIRKGFPGQKSTVNKQRKSNPERPTNRSHDNANKIASSSVSETPSEIQIVKKEFIPRTSASFVPRQLRQQMKKKLNLTTTEPELDASEAPNTQSSAEDEPGPSKEKKIKVDQQLSNNDFRELLKK